MSSLKLENKIGIEGRIAWLQVINEDGSVDQELGASKNVILDQGLNDLASNTTFTPPSSSSAIDEVAIGVGDTAPSQTDTALDNEKARTSALFDDGWEYSADGSDPYYHTIYAVYETPKGLLDSAVDGTYKEFGAVSGDSGNLFSRNLFRDSNGDSTTINVASDQKLRFRYEVILQLEPNPATAGSFDITNIGTINYEGKVLNTYYFLDNMLRPLRTSSIALHLIGGVDVASFTWPDIQNGGNELFTPVSVNQVFSWTNRDAVYSSASSSPSVGVYDVDFFCETTEANFTINAVALARSTLDTYSVFFAAVFDSNNEFTKDSEHELTLTFRIELVRT